MVKPLLFPCLFDFTRQRASAAFRETCDDLDVIGERTGKRFAAILSQLVDGRWERGLREFEDETQVRHFVQTIAGGIGAFGDLEIEDVLRDWVLQSAMNPLIPGRA